MPPFWRARRKTPASSSESSLLNHLRSVAASPLRAASAASSCNTVSVLIRDEHTGAGEDEGRSFRFELAVEGGFSSRKSLS